MIHGNVRVFCIWFSTSKALGEWDSVWNAIKWLVRTMNWKKHIYNRQMTRVCFFFFYISFSSRMIFSKWNINSKSRNPVRHIVWLKDFHFVYIESPHSFSSQSIHSSRTYSMRTSQQNMINDKLHVTLWYKRILPSVPERRKHIGVSAAFISVKRKSCKSSESRTSLQILCVSIEHRRILRDTLAVRWDFYEFV